MHTGAPAATSTRPGNGQQPESNVSFDAQAVRVERVIDGDTLQLADGTTVRYIGVDAPELHARLGSAAAAANRSLVEGQLVRLEFESGRKDRYGRVLAHVWAGDKLVSVELAAQGLASTALFASNLKHSDELLRAQDEARHARRGIWAATPLP